MKLVVAGLLALLTSGCGRHLSDSQRNEVHSIARDEARNEATTAAGNEIDAEGDALEAQANATSSHSAGN